MPNQILQVDENMLETKLDRLVSEKVEQLLNAMLDAEADEITGACRRSYTLECKTNAARRALEGERGQAGASPARHHDGAPPRALGGPRRPGGARRGLHADERVPVDAPLPERGDTGTDGQEKRADAGRTDARGRR